MPFKVPSSSVLSTKLLLFKKWFVNGHVMNVLQNTFFHSNLNSSCTRNNILGTVRISVDIQRESVPYFDMLWIWESIKGDHFVFKRITVRTWFFPLVQRTFNESQVVKFLVCDAELCTGVLIRAAYASSLSGGLSWDALSFGLFLAKPQNCRMPFGGISLCSSVSRCRSVVIWYQISPQNAIAIGYSFVCTNIIICCP